MFQLKWFKKLFQKQKNAGKPVKSEIELDGHIYFVEKDENGKVVSKIELDPDLCLQVIIYAIEEGLKKMTKETIQCKNMN